MGTTTTKAAPAVRQVRLDELVDSKLQLRQTYDPAEIEALAESMREVFFGTLLGRPARDEDGVEIVELVDGHRRKRAAKVAGLATVPVEVRELDDDQVVRLMLAASSGVPLKPLEEAKGIQQLHDTGARVEEIAAEIGRPVAFVRQRLALAGAPERARCELAAGTLGVGHVLIVAGLPPELQDEALDFALNEEATQAELARWAEGRSQDLARAPWELTDAQLHPRAGACTGCPKRTGATADLFPGVVGDRCLDPECWAQKLKLHEGPTFDVDDGEDIKRALERRGFKLRRNGTKGRMDVVVIEHGGVVLENANAADVRAWLIGGPKFNGGSLERPPAEPVRKGKGKGKALPAAGDDEPAPTPRPARTPIERAIDEACGVGAPKPSPSPDSYRAEELRRRELFLRVFKALPLDPRDQLRRPELETLAEYVLSIASEPESELILAAIGSDTGETGPLEDLTDRELSRLLLAAALAADTNPYTASPDGTRLEDVARRLGVLDEPKVEAPSYEAKPGRLPRGRCPVCWQDVALRKGGLVREHDADGKKCKGSSKPDAGWDEPAPKKKTAKKKAKAKRAAAAG